MRRMIYFHFLHYIFPHFLRYISLRFLRYIFLHYIFLKNIYNNFNNTN